MKEKKIDKFLKAIEKMNKRRSEFREAICGYVNVLNVEDLEALAEYLIKVEKPSSIK